MNLLISDKAPCLNVKFWNYELGIFWYFSFFSAYKNNYALQKNTERKHVKKFVIIKNIF